jgi:colicin import membrane protein
MANPIRTTLVLGVLACLTACEDTEKLQAMQKQADQRVAEAERTASAKVEKLRAEMEALRAEYDKAAAQAKTAATAAIEEARSDADSHAKEAEKALARAREAYKAEGRVKLKALSDDEHELRGKLAKLKTKAKSDVKSAVDKALKEADALQKDIAKDLAEFDKASLSEFRTVKAKLSADLAKLKSKLAAASAKLPKT